jgi:hypothetical protein
LESGQNRTNIKYFITFIPLLKKHMLHINKQHIIIYKKILSYNPISYLNIIQYILLVYNVKPNKKKYIVLIFFSLLYSNTL